MKKTAKLFRMNNKNHICPFGIKSKDLLENNGYEVEDHQFQNRQEIEEFKETHNVKTTPQTFIDGNRIGGYEDLLKFFNKKSLKAEGKNYQPIIAVFSMTLLMAIATNFLLNSSFKIFPTIELFIAFSMCVLAILKLRDLYSFSNQFITYDLLAQKFVKYAYIYPVFEGLAGVLMISKTLVFISAPISLFIGTVGAISVFKAVYIDKRDLKCACVGGDSNVPLGFISLTENIMMIVMGVWMLIAH